MCLSNARHLSPEYLLSAIKIFQHINLIYKCVMVLFNLSLHPSPSLPVLPPSLYCPPSPSFLLLPFSSSLPPFCPPSLPSSLSLLLPPVFSPTNTESELFLKPGLSGSHLRLPCGKKEAVEGADLQKGGGAGALSCLGERLLSLRGYKRGCSIALPLWLVLF